MDDELKKMLVQIMEGQEALKIELKNDISKLGAKIDGEIIPKIEALFDGYKLNTEKLTELGDKVDDLSISVNNLNIKTASTDNKIIEINRKINSR